MADIQQHEIKQIVGEIEGDAEVARRAEMKKRSDIYFDGGKAFLLEQLIREFSEEAVKEMRLAPINILKKIVSKRSTLYKQPPKREAQSGLESDQALIDFYTEELDLNEKMGKANRYFTLFSNVVLYTVPDKGSQKLMIVPPYLYSVVPNPLDRTEALAWIFSAFIEEGRITINDDIPAATGKQGYTREKGYKTAADSVDSKEKDGDTSRRYIFWTDTQHLTAMGNGGIIVNTELGDEQFLNPIEKAPIVNLARDRDNKFWATQFGDTVDLSMAIMLGWTDLLTILKHHGFALLTVVSEEEPKQMTIGPNRAVWLPIRQDGPTPSISYVTADSPLSEAKDLLMELLGLLLTTADLNPKEIGGANSARSFSSGFQALIETADTMEARKSDMAPMRRAEQELWEIIKRWHNWQFDTQSLRDDARKLGRFTDDFGMSIVYADVKPLESEMERLGVVKDMRAQGLLTKKEALKRMNPDLTTEQIDDKLLEIEQELSALHQTAISLAMESEDDAEG